MIRRLRIKFVCINMAIATGMLCVILGMVLHFTGEGLAAESLRGMQAAALEPMGPGQRRPGELRIPCFTLQLGPHGELIAKGSSYDLTDEAFLRQVLDAALATGEPAGLLREAGLRFCLAGPPERPVLVFADASGELAAMERLVETCLFIGCAGFLAFLGLSLLLARWAVRPVDMAWQQQRQFVADASHELKTPLTVILTNAELLQDGGADRDRFVKNILDMSRRMRTLVESLLELARVDGALAEDAMETVDFSRLVSDALLPFEPVFFERGLRLESPSPRGCWRKFSSGSAGGSPPGQRAAAWASPSPRGSSRPTGAGSGRRAGTGSTPSTSASRQRADARKNALQGGRAVL